MSLVTAAGIDAALDAIFHGATTYYLGLIDNSGFVAISSADTMGSHSGWTESTAYSESVRQTWDEAAASGQLITNSASVATFTANAGATIRGIFLTTVSTKGGTTGTLMLAAEFAEAVTLSSGQALKVTLTINGADATVS